MFQQYLNSDFKKYIPDWIATIGIVLAFATYLEWTVPYFRPFTLLNVDIQHQFAEVQIVNDLMLYFLTCIIPLIILIGIILVRKGTTYESIHYLHITLLSFLFSYALTGSITDLLKVWVSRPRPDFLSRCLPKSGTPLDELVTIDVCSTYTEGETNWKLIDGMKSFPSGHSSLSSAGTLYLCLWLIKEFKINKQLALYKWILSLGYLLVGVFVSISRSIDYRHHREDIIVGYSLGCIIAWLSFKKYHTIENSNQLPI